jgi:hypothetical protein
MAIPPSPASRKSIQFNFYELEGISAAPEPSGAEIRESQFWMIVERWERQVEKFSTWGSGLEPVWSGWKPIWGGLNEPIRSG